ncbi:MAG TPA: 4-hydroxy-tetrahydrodipicolinate reductase [Bacteroidales bacterium]|nr:4-hydroxy-tetrahydrodipicolinate reductase [Bacteroidales bacterium]
MNIALLGYGRMGQEIELNAPLHGHTIVLKIDGENRDDLTATAVKDVDVAIEFTGPAAAPDMVLMALSLGLPVVSGSTGWLHRYDEIRDYCLKINGTFLHSSNFSIGVNILFRLNSDLARIMSSLGAYKVTIEEIHHIRKLDSPSGTAVTLAEEIARQHADYDGWKKAEEMADPKHVPVTSLREGATPGTHSVIWESDIDRITLRHEALNRRGFAAGALLAAEYIAGRKGVFSMSDVLSL